MTDIRLIGKSPAPGRQLYVARLSKLDDWPARFDEPVRPFVVFTALDAKRLTDVELREFARMLLDQGCVYTCTWGKDAGRVENAFDLVATDAGLAGRPYVEDVVMTTSHEDESLDDALWFAVFAAYPPDVEAQAVLVISEDKWAGEIESRLADSERWSARVVEAEGEGGA